MVYFITWGFAFGAAFFGGIAAWRTASLRTTDKRALQGNLGLKIQHFNPASSGERSAVTHVPCTAGRPIRRSTMLFSDRLLLSLCRACRTILDFPWPGRLPRRVGAPPELPSQSSSGGFYGKASKSVDKPNSTADLVWELKQDIIKKCPLVPLSAGMSSGYDCSNVFGDRLQQSPTTSSSDSNYAISKPTWYSSGPCAALNLSDNDRPAASCPACCCEGAHDLPSVSAGSNLGIKDHDKCHYAPRMVSTTNLGYDGVPDLVCLTPTIHQQLNPPKSDNNMRELLSQAGDSQMRCASGTKLEPSTLLHPSDEDITKRTFMSWRSVNRREHT